MQDVGDLQIYANLRFVGIYVFILLKLWFHEHFREGNGRNSIKMFDRFDYILKSI